MKLVLISGVCFFILYNGLKGIINNSRNIKAVDGIIRLVKYIKTEMNYKKPDYNTLYESLALQGFYGVCFYKGKITADKRLSDNIREELDGFVSRIGTTDKDGQLELCDEYALRFNTISEALKQEQKSKSQIDFAVSLLCAATVFVVFI